MPHYRFNKEPDVLHGFQRTLVEIEWLLLALVMFYLVVGNIASGTKALLLFSTCVYAVLVFLFRYANCFLEARTWKIATQTWGMILFVTWVIWYTGKLDSPLFNLYLLPIIVSAIALGRMVALLETVLVCVCFALLLNNAERSGGWFTLSGGSELALMFFPMFLVAYITSLLSSDIQSGFSRLKIDSETDELTSLFNMRTFKVLGNKICSQAERHKRPFAVLMVDADNLKKVNDVYGHGAGDLLLHKLAQCFNATLRSGDIAARYGGDEFVVLLPDCGEAQAVQVADRIIAELHDGPLRYQGQKLEMSASIGVACFPTHGKTLDDLLLKADKAMYRSKRAGKCMSTCYGSEPETVA